MTKTKLLQLLPVRDFPLAVAVAVIVIVSLGLAGHPPEEWPAIVMVFYLAFRLSLTLVVGLLAYAARFLAGYGERVLRRHGVDVSRDESEDAGSRRVRLWLVAAIVSTVFSVSVGVGIFVSMLAIGWLEITPLASAFRLASWSLLGYGAVGLLLMLGAPTLVFLVADARIRVSDARLASAFSLLPEIQAGIPSARNR